MRCSSCVVALVVSAGAALGEVKSGEIVVKEGDALAGSTVSSVNAPFTNGNGQVGLVIPLEDDRRAIWFDTGAIFTSDEALPDSLTGGEGTMGVGDNGEFIYSPSFNGDDAVFGQDGLILVENTQAPGFDPGINSTFHSRPQMTDDGTAYWISGFNDGAGGTSSIGRMLYKRDPGGAISVVVKAGDLIDGVPVDDGSGVGFSYAFSGDNSNMINEVGLGDLDTLVVNGSGVAQEGASTGQGDNWDNFDAVSINSAGNYVFSGDTDGDTGADEFIAYNGEIVLREGDSAAGVTIDGSVDALSINELGQAAFIWEDTNGEALFFAPDASNLADTATILLAVGDEFDADGDSIADWIIDDFNASAAIGPGLDLAEDGLVYFEVDLVSLDGGTNVEAILSMVVPTPGSAALLAMAGLVGARRRR